LRLARTGKITIADIAEAGAAAPVRANGSGEHAAADDLDRPEPTIADPEPAVDRGPEPALTVDPAPVPLESGVGVGFFALGPRMCKFPLWGNEIPSVDQMRYCGGKTLPDKVYCAVHCKIAFLAEPQTAPGAPRRRPGRVRARSWRRW
jgi:hypothetical protein